MLLISAFLLTFALASAYRENQNDVNKYIDEALSVHLPRHVEDADLDIYEMPDFYFNVQEFSVSNEGNDGTVTFYRGNLTGLSTVQRRFCHRSLRSTDSVSIICNIILPRVDVEYRGRYEVSTGSFSSYKDQVYCRIAATIAEDDEIIFNAMCGDVTCEDMDDNRFFRVSIAKADKKEMTFLDLYDEARKIYESED
ncbi:uncharacterized protein TNIN_446361 [Trichonephila inaurata madagascariensis]|uniref:Uncharacterized protein n=1 Tax=Trichonephila inaurata madagascariensis TaxID=2747483 RepID=A0A8X6IXB2_9ARAC|nr:uncharacterized protein TNIN_446361 [Trichonephila inaurata madagascariensis]